jgi:hypothetical protein
LILKDLERSLHTTLQGTVTANRSLRRVTEPVPGVLDFAAIPCTTLLVEGLANRVERMVLVGYSTIPNYGSSLMALG